MAEVTYRTLHEVGEFRRVMALEREIWAVADDELVPSSLLVPSVKCGAVVIGAFAGDELVGFAYSFPGRRNAQALHWSHMLGVAERYRAAGVGYELKQLQRQQVLSQGIDRIEWTFDPLQAANAHFNFNKLGVLVREYVEDVYGDSSSRLHRGAPTDRFVAEWLVGPGNGHQGEGHRGTGDTSSPVVNPMRHEGRFWRCDADAPLLLDTEVLRIAVPPDFTTMLVGEPALAHEWRLTTRRLFEDAFAAGFVAVGFERDDASRGGSYILRR